jgi:cytochrome P450
MVVHETLRLHPPAGIMTRLCVKDFDGDGFKLKKGDQIHIPVTGIHMDPKFYPDPETFDPQNFSKDNKANRSP